MLNENAKKWVEALRSGKYEQGQRALCRNDRYCCLGVACEVAVQNGVKVNVIVEENGLISYDGEIYKLPSVVKNWLKLKTHNGVYHLIEPCTLIADNDDRKLTFAQIADIIESEPERLFVKKR